MPKGHPKNPLRKLWEITQRQQRLLEIVLEMEAAKTNIIAGRSGGPGERRFGREERRVASPRPPI